MPLYLAAIGGFRFLCEEKEKFVGALEGVQHTRKGRSARVVSVTPFQPVGLPGTTDSASNGTQFLVAKK
jgi:hypothetical protein